MYFIYIQKRIKPLSAEELELLLTAIEPDANYQHQIGMAKPYGYGQIRLDITSISLIDNAKRYQSLDDTDETSLWPTAATPAVKITTHRFLAGLLTMIIPSKKISKHCLG